MNDFFTLMIQNWQSAWANKRFRNVLLVEILIMLILMLTTTIFFDYIQNQKDGVVLNDWLLKNLPALDVSLFIVAIETSVIFLSIIRSAVNPNMAIVAIMASVFQLAFRIVTINFTRFLPPQGLIELKDPIGSLLYHHSRFITRDLFYSGHTAVLFIFAQCAYKKWDRYYMAIAGVLIGCLVLVQHIHYTVDVAFAPFFAFACYWLANKILVSRSVYVTPTLSA